MGRLKRILKWTGIVLGVLVATVLIGNAWFVWTTGTRLERQLAAIRQAGDPLSIAELARKPIPPEKNAATFLRRAEADVEAIDNELATVPDISDYRGSRLPPEDVQSIKAALAAHPKVIPILEQAAACPNYDAQLDYSLPAKEFQAQLIEIVPKVRRPARVLRQQATVLLAEGNRDEAVRTALVILRLARHFDRNPLLVSYLVAMAVRSMAIEPANLALQAGPVSKETQDALEAELALVECADTYVRALKSERAFMRDMLGAYPSRNFWLVSRAFWNSQESDCLDVTQTLLAVASKPTSYRADAEAIQTTLPRLGVLGQLEVSSLRTTHEATTRRRALVRCLRVLNALQAHTAAEGDKVPKLSELGLPVEATTDPFTGEPLHVKQLPEGWLVYSVGKNYQDDSGKLDDFENGDVGIGPPIAVAKPSEK